MRRIVRSALGVLGLVGLVAQGALAVSVGDAAPAFEFAGSDGKTHALSDFVGKRGVVLAWFPKAFTPG